jgi:hypothetical protein
MPTESSDSQPDPEEIEEQRAFARHRERQRRPIGPYTPPEAKKP